MKKFFLVLVFLPFVSFGSFEFQGWIVERMRIFKYSSFGVTDSPSRAITVYPSSVDDLSSALSSSTFGFCVNLGSSTSQKMVAPIPTSAKFFVFDSSASDTTITNSLYFSSPSNCVVSSHYIPSVSAIYYSASLLYINGYRGAGIVNDFSSGIIHCVNVNYPTLVADIVSSTNTVYRQILFSYLSQINTSLSSIGSNAQSIALDVSSLSSSVSALSDSVASNSISIAGVSSNLVSLVDPVLGVYSNTSFSASALAQVSSNSAATASSLAQVSSNSAATVSSLAQVSSNSAATVSALSDISANTSSSAASLSSIDSSSSAAAQTLSSVDYNIGRVHDSFGAFRGDFDNAAAYLSASVAGGAVPSPDNPFFPYNPNDPSDPNHPSNPSSPWNPNSPNFVAGGGGQGAFTTNHVLRPITNVVRQAASDVASNATQNAENIRSDNLDHHNDLMNLLQGDGVNARIVFPWYGVDQQAVNVDSESFHVWGASLDKIESSLGNIYSSSQTDWQRWFDRWDSQFPNLTNLVFDILCSISNSLDRSYMLLDDYAEYISNGVYSVSLEAFSEDFPNVYSNLLKYGLHSSGDGNFWSLFGSSLLYQSSFIGSVLDDMATVRKFADDNIEGGFFSGISSILSLFPSKTQIEDVSISASNVVISLDQASIDLVSAFHSVTSRASSVFSPFEGSFDSVPSDLVLFKTGNEQYVTIPVSDHPEAFQLMRWGFAFALAAVNFIFFPKFVLMLVMLFSKLSQRFVKFYPSVKDE